MERGDGTHQIRSESRPRSMKMLAFWHKLRGTVAPPSLVLGFIGSQETHQENSKALIEDLIAAYRKLNKGAEIRLVLAIEPTFTDTLEYLANYCVTKGYKLGLVGHADAFDQPAVKPYLTDAAGSLLTLLPEQGLGRAFVSYISVWNGAEARLILIADPNDQDEEQVYEATMLAIEKGVKVRSLLKGLDEVLLRDEAVVETEEGETDVSPRTETNTAWDDDEDEGEDYEVDDEVDDDDLDEEPDEDDVPEDDEPEEEEEDESEDDEPVAEDEEEPEPAPRRRKPAPAAPVAKKRPAAKKAAPAPARRATPASADAPTPRWTQARLQRKADSNRDEFYEIAAGFGVFPGRGKKVSTLIKEVLERIDGGAAPRATKRAAAPAKKAPAKAAPARVAKAAPASARRARTATAEAPSNGKVRRLGSDDIKALLDVVEHAAKVLRHYV